MSNKPFTGVSQSTLDEVRAVQEDRDLELKVHAHAEMVYRINAAMSEQQYSLWVVADGKRLFKVPVYNYSDAKAFVDVMHPGRVTGMRIARYCPLEGCEVVLHKFEV